MVDGALVTAFTAAEVEVLVRAGKPRKLGAALRTSLPEDAVRFLLSDGQALGLRVGPLLVAQSVLGWQARVPADAFEAVLNGSDPVVAKAVVAGFGARRADYVVGVDLDREMELAGVFLRFARTRRVEGAGLKSVAWSKHLSADLMVELLAVTTSGVQEKFQSWDARFALARRRVGTPVPLVVLRGLWGSANPTEKQAMAAALVRQQCADEALLLDIISRVDKDDWWLVGAVENPSASAVVREAAVGAAVRASTRLRLVAALAPFPDTLLMMAGGGRSAAGRAAVRALPLGVVLGQGSVTARVNLALQAGELMRARRMSDQDALVLAGDGEVRVRTALAASPGVPAEVLGVLAGDGSAAVRQAVLNNAGAGLGLVTELLGDSAGSVRELASVRFGQALGT